MKLITYLLQTTAESTRGYRWASRFMNIVAKQRRQQDEEHTGHSANYQLISLLERQGIYRPANKNRKMAQTLSSDSAGWHYYQLHKGLSGVTKADFIKT